MTLAHRCCILVLSLIAIPEARGQKGKGSDPLEEIRTLLAGPKEERVKEGAERCLKLNSADSIELLLDVLRGPNPHFRDIVWEQLQGFTDPNARARVEREMHQGHDEEVRGWCADLLGRFQDASFGKALDLALNSKPLPLLRAACRSLGQLRFEAAIKKLDALTTHKDAIVRANAFEALARIDPERYQKQFLKGFADSDGGVRACLLGAMPDLYPELSAKQSLAMLNDGDWRVCARAIDNLATKSAPDDVIETLIKMTRHPRPALQQRAHAALSKITGQKWTTAIQWEGWWQAKKAGTARTSSGPGETPAAPAPSFFGHYILSDHVAFVIDRCAKMDHLLKDESGTRAEDSIEELQKALGHLPDGIQFNVYCYADTVTALAERPLKLDDRQRKAAIAFVRSTPIGGKKDVWRALSTVLPNPTLDTIFLLSSGEPEVGLYVHHNRVAAHIKDLNRFYQVTIHAVVYDEGGYLFQIEEISKVTGGRCLLRQ